MNLLIEIAIRNLIQARRRSIWIGAALALVTFLLVLLLALAQGLADTMLRSATTLASGHVNVGGFFKAGPDDAAPLVTDAQKILGLIESKVPHGSRVIERQRGWARLVSDSNSMNVGLVGIAPAAESRLFEVLGFGGDPSSEESLASGGPLVDTDGAVIFETQAKRLGVRVGDPLTITIETFRGVRNTADIQITGIAEDAGLISSWTVFVHEAKIRELYLYRDDSTGVFQIYLDDASRADEVLASLRTAIEASNVELMEYDPRSFFMKFELVAGEDWVGQKLDLTTWRDEVSYLDWVLTALNAVSFMLVSILLVIIIVGIMNAMWISVRERTQEIGMVRAIGMSKNRVLSMFMIEAVTLALVSTTTGALAGGGLSLVLNAARLHVPSQAMQVILMSNTLQLAVRPAQMILAVFVLSAVTALASLLPALRASRLRPITAIHHIG